MIIKLECTSNCLDQVDEYLSSYIEQLREIGYIIDTRFCDIPDMETFEKFCLDCLSLKSFDDWGFGRVVDLVISHESTKDFTGFEVKLRDCYME